MTNYRFLLFWIPFLFVGCNFNQNSSEEEKLNSDFPWATVRDLYSGPKTKGHLDTVQKQLDDWAAENDITDSLVLGYKEISVKYLNLSLYAEGYTTLHKALQLAKKLNNATIIASLYAQAGTTFISVGDYTLAKENMEKAASLALENKLYGQLATIWFEMARNEIQIGNLTGALKYAEQGLKLSDYMTHHYRVHFYNAIGLIHKKADRFPLAINNYLHAINIASDSLPHFGFILGNIGQVYVKMGLLDSASSYMKRNIQFSLETKNVVSARNASLTLAKVYLQMGNRKEALRYLNLSDSLSGEIKEEVIFPKTSFIRLEIISGMKSEKEQLIASTEYIRSVDQMIEAFNLNVKNQHTSLLALHQAIKEIDELETQRESEKLHHKILITTGLSIVGFLMFVLSVLYGRSINLKQKNRIQLLVLEAKDSELILLKKEKQLQEKEIELQNQIAKSQERQLEISKKSYQQLAMAKEYKIELKNKLINHITKAIQPIERFPEDVRKKIDDVFRTINKIEDNSLSTYLDKEDESGSFIPALQHDFPDLTSEEIKLCTYIRLNMSTKEIARLKMISLPGVSKSRNRLRKKLGLNPSDDLQEFLMSY